MHSGPPLIEIQISLIEVNAPVVASFVTSASNFTKFLCGYSELVYEDDLILSNLGGVISASSPATYENESTPRLA